MMDKVCKSLNSVDQSVYREGPIVLVISESTLPRMMGIRALDLAPKIAPWLESELPGWRASPGSPAWKDLEDIMLLGSESGMIVETDFALLALLLLGQGDWRAAVKDREIAAMLRNREIDPPSRLMWLEERLA